MNLSIYSIEKSRYPAIASALLLLGCAALLFARYLWPAFSSPSFIAPGDFSVYLLAWQRMKAGLIPYVISDGSPYKYSPSILCWLALLPENPAQAWGVFGGMSLLAWVAGIFLGTRFTSWKSFGGLALGLALSWKGVLESFDYGQMEFFLFFIAICGARAFSASPFASGLLLGFLPSFKLPWLVFFAPFFLKATRISRGYTLRLIGGYALAGLLWAAILPVSLFGFERTRLITAAWFRLLRAQPHELYASDINQSFLSLGLRIFAPDDPIGHAITFAGVLILSGVALGILMKRTDKEDFPSENFLGWTAPWMIFTQLVNPLAWRWGSVLTVGAPFSMRQSCPKWLWGVIGVLWCLQQTPLIKFMGLSHWTDLHHYNLVTLYWFALLFL